MDKFWKDNQKEKEKCDACYNYVYPKEIKGEYADRKICPKCGYTMEITVKPRKLKARDW